MCPNLPVAVSMVFGEDADNSDRRRYPQVLASMGVDPAIRAQFASMGPEGEAFLLALLMQVAPPPAPKPDPNPDPEPLALTLTLCLFCRTLTLTLTLHLPTALTLMLSLARSSCRRPAPSRPPRSRRRRWSQPRRV